ncbi:hypothetical protein [Aeoliella sp. SH292]|uniref:hypothetical protein n=1 Tax=Aeoliella sp. SH292 TaxID=3454464 RepID=UPI003F95FCA9
MFALSILVGCNSGSSTKGTVEGTITVDGQPAGDGSISFVPLDGKSPTAGGKIEAGTYRAEVPLGRSKVEIRIPKQVGERKAYNTPDSHMIPVIKEVLPGKYNDYSELEVDVKPGSSQCNFDLLSK